MARADLSKLPHSKTLRSPRVRTLSLAFRMVIQVCLSSEKVRTYLTVCSVDSQILDFRHSVCLPSLIFLPKPCYY